MIVVARNWDTDELEERDVDPTSPNTVKINGERFFLSEEMAAARQVEWAENAATQAAEEAIATTEDANKTSIRATLLGEIDAVLTEADALQTILDQWEVTPPSNAAVLAHVKRLTRDLIRMARDVVRLVRLELRKLEAT